MPGGTSVARNVTSVPAGRGSKLHVMIIVPANAGSSEAKSTASTIQCGGSELDEAHVDDIRIRSSSCPRRREPRTSGRMR